jgi:hypothetical protein
VLVKVDRELYEIRTFTALELTRHWLIASILLETLAHATFTRFIAEGKVKTKRELF